MHVLESLLHWLPSVWAFAAHHHLADAVIGGVGYRVWKAFPRWLAQMRLATTNDPEKAERLRKDVEALAPPWRWPWQRDD